MIEGIHKPRLHLSIFIMKRTVLCRDFTDKIDNLRNRITKQEEQNLLAQLKKAS